MGTYLTADGNTTIYAQDESLAQAFVRYTKEELQDVARSFFKIGFRLAEANKYRYYEELGYDNIIDLAEDVFGFKKSTAYGLMQVYHHCKSRDKNDSALTMDKAYQDFNFSQLQEISRLKWGGGEHLIKPTDSVAKIKQFVSAWNKDGERSNASGCESINDYLRKTGRLTEAEPAALPAPNLLELDTAPEPSDESPQKEIFQTSGKSEDKLSASKQTPAVVDCELIETQEANADFVDGEDYSQYDEDEPTAPTMTDGELIDYCLKAGYGIGEKGKFEIYDFYYYRQPTRNLFLDFIKRKYGTGGHGGAGELIYEINYSASKGVTITRKSGGKLELPWTYITGRINRLIESCNYLDEEEHARYISWKADREGLVVNVEDGRTAAEPAPSADVLPISDKEYDTLIKNLDELIEPKNKAKAKLLNLKNVKARQAWLDGFRNWGVWLEVKEVDKTFYRYDFANGAALIVEVGFEYWSFSSSPGARERIAYAILDNNHDKYDSKGICYTDVITWLTAHAKEV